MFEEEIPFSSGAPYLIPSLGLGSARRPFGFSCGSWLGSGLLPSENSAQVFFERRQKLLVAERSTGLLVSTQEFDVLFSNDPREKPTPWWRQLEQGSDLNECVVLSSHMGSRAAPPITARGLDQPRAHRVKLDVPRRGQDVRLIEHKRREPSLPQMASPPLAKVDHSGVTPMDLADRQSQPVGRLRNSDEMDVIGHQAVCPDFNLMDGAPLPHQFQIVLVILIAKKRLLPTVSPLGDVVRKARYYNSC